MTAATETTATERAGGAALRVTAIVQARVSSSRLPRKVLRPLHGKPMLAYLIEGLRQCVELDDIVVATSDRTEDDALDALCAEAGTPCVRGPLDDVAARFAAVLRSRPADAFVRINGDSPLLHPDIVDRAVSTFRGAAADMVTNVHPRTFPPGQSVEVMGAHAFLAALPHIGSAEEREHVTLHVYRHPDRFRIVNIAADPPLPRRHMAVDSEADWQSFAACVAALDRPHWRYPLAELVWLWPEPAAGPHP